MSSQLRSALGPKFLQVSCFLLLKSLVLWSQWAVPINRRSKLSQVYKVFSLLFKEYATRRITSDLYAFKLLGTPENWVPRHAGNSSQGQSNSVQWISIDVLYTMVIHRSKDVLYTMVIHRSKDVLYTKVIHRSKSSRLEYTASSLDNGNVWAGKTVNLTSCYWVRSYEQRSCHWGRYYEQRGCQCYCQRGTVAVS
jgi:hypothetical protein